MAQEPMRLPLYKTILAHLGLALMVSSHLGASLEWPVSAEGIVRMEVAQVSDKEAREFKSRSSPRLGCEDGWGGGSSGGSRA